MLLRKRRSKTKDRRSKSINTKDFEPKDLIDLRPVKYSPLNLLSDVKRQEIEGVFVLNIRPP